MATRSWVVAVGAALVAIFALSVAVTVNGGLQWDDFANLRFSTETGTLDFVLRPVFDHFAPGHRLLTLVQYGLGPSDTAPMHVLMSALQTVAFAGFIACAAQLYGRRAWIPAWAVVVSAGTSVVVTQLWFSAAFHQIPALTAGLWSLYAFLRFRANGAGRHLVLSVTLVVVGMTFVSKVLLFVGVVFLLDQLLLRPLERARDIAGRVADEWPLWLAYALPVTVYLVITSEVVTPTLDPSRPGPVIGGIRLAWLERFVPGLIGWDPVLTTPDPDLRFVLVILLQGAAATFVFLSAQRRRDSLRALAIVVLVALVNGYMTLVLRVDAFGEPVSLTYRYWLEPIVIGALLLPWGFARPIDSDAPAWSRPTSRALRSAAAPLAILSVAAVSALSLVRLVEADNAYQARAWLEDLQSAVASSAEPSPSIVDDVTPVAWTPIWTLRDFQFLLPDARFLDDPDGQLVVDGGLEPPVYDPFFDVTGASLADNSLVRIDGDATPIDESLCAAASADIEVVVQPSDRRRFAQLTITGSGTVDFVPIDDVGQELPLRRLLEGDANGRDVFFPADLWPWTSFRLRLLPTDGASLCVDRLSVGIVRNAPRLP